MSFSSSSSNVLSESIFISVSPNDVGASLTTRCRGRDTLASRNKRPDYANCVCRTRRSLRSGGLLGVRGGYALRPQCFAHGIAGETADHHVLAQLGDLGCDQFADRLIRVLDEPLLEQANRAVELVQLTFHDLREDVLRLALHLALVNQIGR